MVICIAGMHRSGTSMIARMLNICGVHLGEEKDLIPPAGDNPEGFWENDKFRIINEEILACFNGSWDLPPLFGDGWTKDPRLLHIHSRASKLIKEFSAYHLWGWKDPRNSLTLPFWQAHISGLKIIVCLRNPYDVYLSLSRRGYASNTFSYALWLTYSQQLLAAAEDENRIITHFDSYFHDPQSELRRLLNFLQIEADDETLAKACKTISVDLRHSSGKINDLLASNAPQNLIQIYKELCLQAGPVYLSSLDEQERSSLDKFEPNFETDVERYKKLLASTTLETERLLNQVFELNDIIKQKTNNIQTIEDDLKKLRESYAQLQDELKISQEAYANLRNALKVSQEFYVNLQNELKISQEAHAQLQDALKISQESYAQLQDELKISQESYAKLQDELKMSQESFAQLQERLNNLLKKRLSYILRKIFTLFTHPLRIFKKILSGLFYGLTNIHKVPSVLRREGMQGLLLRLHNRINVNAVLQTNNAALQTTDITHKKIYEQLVSMACKKIKDDYVPLSDENVSSEESTIKLIAFYLPQFHPIPLNDEFWGKGFTEWMNVSKATPQFVGHYQPRLPGELGFYDLRVPEIQKRQIELAKKYGIYGFCFHYYWFNGQRLLRKPLDLFLESKEDFPFCVCWANENWTRRWDGQENDILIAQEHSPESDLRFIKDILPLFQDKRYIRINGRPVLIIYRPNILSNVSETVKRWREYCQANGIATPYLIAAQTFWFTDPREVNFDAAVEFPPHNIALPDISHLLKIANPNYSGNIFDYKDIVKKCSSASAAEYKLFKTVFPGWDNEARKPGCGYTFAFSSPELYKNWLLNAAKVTLQEKCPEKRLLFINAWNEWAEGAYLEPDQRYGYAYLQATADAVKEISLLERNLSTYEMKTFDTRNEFDSRMNRPVIVFQSGKVGSTSLHLSLEKKFKELEISTPVYHAHILEKIDQRIERIKQIRTDPSASIQKLLESKKIRQQIDNNHEQCWSVISLVRDPVAKKISTFFQLIDEYIPDWKKQWKSGELKLEDLQKMFFKKSGDNDPGQWFDNQIKPIWGIDIFKTPFDKTNGYHIYTFTPRVNLMIIRMEDLNRVAENAFREFMGLESFSIISTNVGEEKPYRKLYEQFKKLPLPASYLDKEYSSRYARYFYTENEIAAFRKHWLEN